METLKPLPLVFSGASCLLVAARVEAEVEVRDLEEMSELYDHPVWIWAWEQSVC